VARGRQTSPTHLADPLAVIPCHAPGVEVKESPEGDYHLRKRYPPGRGLMAFMKKRLGWRHECYYNLDARGTEFWKLLNGERTLHEVAAIVQQRWELEEAEARRAAVQYVRSLMLRNLLELEVKGANADGSRS
jgi:hypothetical protein